MKRREGELVIIASRIYAPEGGAAAFRLSAVGRAITRAGHRLRVLTTTVPGSSTGDDPQVKRWPAIRDSSGAVRGYLSYASFDIPLFFRLLTGPLPAVVLSETPPTTGLAVYLACALRRRPFVYFAADVLSTAAKGIGVNRVVVWMLRALEGFVVRRARSVLTISDGVSREILALGVRPERIENVGTGVDTDTFRLDGPVLDLGGSAFVYAGTISEIQGAGIFIEAFGLIAAERPDARLVFFGRGTEERELRARAAELSDRIEFRGQASGETVAAAYRGAVAGLASVRPHSGYDFAHATKAYASAACGAPVLYAGVGAARSIVEAESLGSTTDWTAAAVADTMRQMLDAREPLESRARIASWIEENASLNAVARQCVEALDRAMAEE